MLDHLILTIASTYRLPREEILSEIEFILGRNLEHDADISKKDEDRVLSFFSRTFDGLVDNRNNPDHQTTLRKLHLRDWRQFEKIDIDFSNKLTIITGENGTGKTSILNIVAQVLGDNIQFLGTLAPHGRDVAFTTGLRRKYKDHQQIGSIYLSSGEYSRILISDINNGTSPFFKPEISPFREISGIYLNTQRYLSSYQKLENLPPRFRKINEIAQEYKQETSTLFDSNKFKRKSPALLIKENLIAAAIYSQDNSSMRSDPLARRVWFEFQNILQLTLPESIRFSSIITDRGELILRTGDGDFPLEASSGGINSLINLAWEIYLCSVDSPEVFTVCIDEPENHLHPSMQRSLLPSLRKAFPKVNFIVATHSPFIITSMRDSSVYSLKRGANGVHSEEVNLKTSALTAEQVLDGILGVRVTIPEWAEEELNSIIKDALTSDKEVDISDLIQQLEDSGVNLMSTEVSAILSQTISNIRGDSDEEAE